ncbi:hypothetical protein [Rhodococcus baikonurensis]|uniref:Uncharacterized protein n=1 Tax=Rhodococcus baikonurensis TaxID=172041 RepID=A0ABV5XBS9_9NOCA
MSTVDKRRQTALPQPSKGLGRVREGWTPCAYDVPLFDLNHASFADACYAKSLCLGRNGGPACPMLARCNAEIEADKPRDQIKGGRIFSSRGAELKNDRALLGYLNRVEAQRTLHGDPDADPLELVQAGDFDSEVSEQWSADRETLRSLEREVATASGVQFTLDLGA